MTAGAFNWPGAEPTHEQEFPVGVKNLDTVVLQVSYVEVAFAVEFCGLGVVELTRPGP